MEIIIAYIYIYTGLVNAPLMEVSGSFYIKPYPLKIGKQFIIENTMKVGQQFPLIDSL